MTEYDNTNRGAVWRNDKRETDSHPHFKGQANVAGAEYWVSAWIGDTTGGKPALKFNFQPKEPKAPAIEAGGEMAALAELAGTDPGEQEARKEYVPGEDKELNDDIPF